MNEYVVYRGDKIIAIGTLNELSYRLNLTKKTLMALSSPSRHRRRAGKKGMLVYKVGKEYEQ